MSRLTRPTVNVDETAAKYMASKEIELRTMNERLLELILNGPTLKSVPKDYLRHMIRQLYGALQSYEDTGLEPEEIVKMQTLADGIVQKYGRLYELAKAEEEGHVLIDVAQVKREIKPKADSTLRNMRKDDLIDYIRTLEHNYNVAVTFNEQQAQNIEKMLRDMQAGGRMAGTTQALKIIEVDPSVGELVRQNDGYCPCLIDRNQDTRCPCKDFREQQEPGPCHCGRYEKVIR